MISPWWLFMCLPVAWYLGHLVGSRERVYGDASASDERWTLGFITVALVLATLAAWGWTR